MGDDGLDRYVSGELDDLGAAVAALRDPEVLAALSAVLTEVVDALRAGGILLLAGNGGSAADADHLVAEFLGRCTRERGPLPAIALTASNATVTAVANDYGYDTVFSRQVATLAGPGDVVILLSTSGASANVVAAAGTARERGARVVAFVGAGPSPLADAADVALHAPSRSTQRVQELHKFFGHVLVGWVDQELS
jgi:phosphoheptose isomerase